MKSITVAGTEPQSTTFRKVTLIQLVPAIQSQEIDRHEDEGIGRDGPTRDAQGINELGHVAGDANVPAAGALAG